MQLPPSTHPFSLHHCSHNLTYCIWILHIDPSPFARTLAPWGQAFCPSCLQCQDHQRYSWNKNEWPAYDPLLSGSGFPLPQLPPLAPLLSLLQLYCTYFISLNSRCSFLPKRCDEGGAPLPPMLSHSLPRVPPLFKYPFFGEIFPNLWEREPCVPLQLFSNIWSPCYTGSLKSSGIMSVLFTDVPAAPVQWVLLTNV